jgi:diaminohydroxyphosphoribosylaminopyrimidine deaminase/5-amino-6-(5-phosphoribosylamino)uracil reductase
VNADEKFMKIALGLAKRGLGNVAPNPAVGCLVVKDDVIIASGWTQPGGRPHAETEALTEAGHDAEGSTVYVTLEPCSHFGQTPPCAGALITAKVSKVVCAITDPDRRVSGRGIQMLREAGIEVVENILQEEAAYTNSGFFTTKTEGRPYVTVKIASTIDAKIATASGESKWITGESARKYGHYMRATHDAILVGVNTIIADDPTLDCRIEGMEEFSPRPVILDSQLRTPTSARVFKRGSPLIFYDGERASGERHSMLTKAGAELICLTNTRDIPELCTELAKRGITRLLLEGGSQVIGSFLKANCVDEIAHFSAPKVIGIEGIAAIADLGLAELRKAPQFKLRNTRRLGADLLAWYTKAE